MNARDLMLESFLEKASEKLAYDPQMAGMDSPQAIAQEGPAGSPPQAGIEKKPAPLSNDQESQLLMFLQNNNNLSDKSFHEYAESIGADHERSEEFAYRLVNKMADFK